MAKNPIRAFLALALCLLALLPGAVTAWGVEPTVYAEAAVLINAETGQVLYEKNAHRRMQPASLTKIMTCLIAMEETRPEELVTVTDEALRLMPDSAAIGLSEGEKLTVAQLLYAAMLPSANDAAAAVGVHIAGSSSAFAEKMNRRATALGLTGSHFSNAHGLPSRNHYTTAYDLAQITREALTHPEFLDYAGRTSYTIPASSHNQAYGFSHLSRALRPGSGAYDPRAIAGKTGWTSPAGNCLMTVAEQNGMRLIAVVLKADDEERGATSYSDTQALFDYGFSAFRPVTLSLPGTGLLTTLEEGGGEYYLSAPDREMQVLLPLSREGVEDASLEVALLPEDCSEAERRFWGEVRLLDRRTGEVLLSAGRISLAGEPLGPEPLGPAAEVYQVVGDQPRDRGDIPLTLAGTLLLVAILAVCNRKGRKAVAPKTVIAEAPGSVRNA